MPIVVDLDLDLDVDVVRREVRLTELAERTGITAANLSGLKNGRARAVRSSTLEATCSALGCQPGDLLGAGLPAGRPAPLGARARTG